MLNEWQSAGRLLRGNEVTADCLISGVSELSRVVDWMLQTGQLASELPPEQIHRDANMLHWSQVMHRYCLSCISS